jgi:hypothetical protein
MAKIPSMFGSDAETASLPQCLGAIFSGSTRRPLTNFPKSCVYSYAFSRDGNKLYVARGYQIRDAVKIKNFERGFGSPQLPGAIYAALGDRDLAFRWA